MQFFPFFQTRYPGECFKNWQPFAKHHFCLLNQICPYFFKIKFDLTCQVCITRVFVSRVLSQNWSKHIWLVTLMWKKVLLMMVDLRVPSVAPPATNLGAWIEYQSPELLYWWDSSSWSLVFIESENELTFCLLSF